MAAGILQLGDSLNYMDVLVAAAVDDDMLLQLTRCLLVDLDQESCILLMFGWFQFTNFNSSNSNQIQSFGLFSSYKIESIDIDYNNK